MTLSGLTLNNSLLSIELCANEKDNCRIVYVIFTAGYLNALSLSVSLHLAVSLTCSALVILDFSVAHTGRTVCSSEGRHA